jgi:cell division protein FtsZ
LDEQRASQQPAQQRPRPTETNQNPNPNPTRSQDRPSSNPPAPAEFQARVLNTDDLDIPAFLRNRNQR